MILFWQTAPGVGDRGRWRREDEAPAHTTPPPAPFPLYIHNLHTAPLGGGKLHIFKNKKSTYEVDKWNIKESGGFSHCVTFITYKQKK